MALAKKMIRLKGYRYPEDIEIKIVGLRPGEKIYEELLVNEENMGKTCHEKIIIAKVNTPGLAFQKAHVERLCAFVKKKQTPTMTKWIWSDWLRKSSRNTNRKILFLKHWINKNRRCMAFLAFCYKGR